MSDDILEINESPVDQGAGETITYKLTTTPWGSSPGSVSVAVVDVVAGAETDVKSTVMPSGSPTASGDVITLPALTALTAGHFYKITITFTCSGNTFTAHGWVNGAE